MKSAVQPRPFDVRYSPQRGHRLAQLTCPLCAKSGHMQCSSRDIQLRHGRTIFRYGEIYYRWCFPDLATARDFHEQFGGILWDPFFELT
jgi:hypothetical protein